MQKHIYYKVPTISSQITFLYPPKDLSSNIFIEDSDLKGLRQYIFRRVDRIRNGKHVVLL